MCRLKFINFAMRSAKYAFYYVEIVVCLRSVKNMKLQFCQHSQHENDKNAKWLHT